jgi:hypothetical protein
MTNPYIVQIARQTGESYSQVAKSARRTPVTLEYAQAQGFNTVDEYLEALHEFLNGQ